MDQIADNTPIIIGVGQYAERLDDPGYRALCPMDLAGQALAAAIADCQSTDDVGAAIDTVAAIRQFEISTPVAKAPFGGSNNVPRSIARRVGANPDRAILEIVGGQGPQKLVGELAQDIVEGRSSCAAIVGAEAISTMLALQARDEQADWSEAVPGSLDDRGYGMKGLIDTPLIAHGVGAPIAGYALLENARRARLGRGLDDYRSDIGRLFAPFTDVAAANPYAAAPIARSADELARITERNRIVAEPYTRLTVARDQVNQGAAILIASAGKARALGIAEDRWVHIHGVCDVKEASVLSRAELDVSPAAIASVRDALDIAGITLDDLAYIDLYSCFAIAVFNLTDALDIAPDDPRGLTLTGGLPFFGGAGNNYSAHAIAEAVQRLRADRKAYAMIGANGGIMSKYATGIYSCRPADWSAKSRWTSLPDEPSAITVVDQHNGHATIESYTILPRRTGDRGVIVARTATGERLVAMADPDHPATLERLAKGDAIGQSVSVQPGGDGRSLFRFL